MTSVEPVTARATTGQTAGAIVTRRGVRAAVAVMGLVTLLLGGLSALAYAVIDRERHPMAWDYVYVGAEMNLPTWWNILLLAGVGLVAAVAGACLAAERVGWFTVAAAAAFLSLDEGSRPHEVSGNLVGLVGLSVPTFAWVVVGAVAAPVGLVVLTLATRPLPGATRRRLALAAAVYIGAALGLEAISGIVFDLDLWGLFLALTHVEEMLEMLACVLAIHTILMRLTPLRVVALADRTPAS